MWSNPSLSAVAPQHLTTRLRVRAQVWRYPDEISCTARPRFGTLPPGCVRDFSAPRSPSWPYVLLPQHLTAPLLVIAQVCIPPAEMARKCPGGDLSGEIGRAHV